MLAGCCLCFDQGLLYVQACAALERALGALEAELLPQPMQTTTRAAAHLQKAMQDLEVRQSFICDCGLVMPRFVTALSPKASSHSGMPWHKHSCY